MKWSVYFKNYRYPIIDTGFNGEEYHYIPEEGTVITAQNKDEARLKFLETFTDDKIQITDIVFHSH